MFEVMSDDILRVPDNNDAIRLCNGKKTTKQIPTICQYWSHYTVREINTQKEREREKVVGGRVRERTSAICVCVCVCVTECGIHRQYWSHSHFNKLFNQNAMECMTFWTHVAAMLEANVIEPVDWKQCKRYWTSGHRLCDSHQLWNDVKCGIRLIVCESRV